MPCLHLGIDWGKRLLTKPWYIYFCTVFTLAQMTEVKLSLNMITIKSNWQQILKPMHKMPAFIREAVALVVLAFYFLVIELQTQVSRFQRLLLLQHLKKLRRKWLILLQIALRKTRRARRALSWRETNSGLKPFCTEIWLTIIGGKRTSEYLDVRSITLSEWLVRINGKEGH